MTLRPLLRVLRTDPVRSGPLTTIIIVNTVRTSETEGVVPRGTIRNSAADGRLQACIASTCYCLPLSAINPLSNILYSPCGKFEIYGATIFLFHGYNGNDSVLICEIQIGSIHVRRNSNTLRTATCIQRFDYGPAARPQPRTAPVFNKMSAVTHGTIKAFPVAGEDLALSSVRCAGDGYYTQIYGFSPKSDPLELLYGGGGGRFAALVRANGSHPIPHRAPADARFHSDGRNATG
ncbi:hypothetical protein EVAR_10525_1 [Eumeta japonica]|uniref:Uncharacterized protein n=1 Tax=Eumeta variegata TaxID=151549 RepID=A0A4C1TKR0_EUMVA|nr:hypothetical protein EVAR_10525_1 [Eumeta japonica]